MPRTVHRAAALLAAIGCATWLGGAEVARAQSLVVPLVFPTSREVVPFAVAGAFVLPALIAGLVGGFLRLGRYSAPLLAACVLAATALTVVALTQPGLLNLTKS